MPSARVQKTWAQIIKRAARGFLAALRTYHRSCAHHLWLQVANWESSITARVGRTNAMTAINTAKTVYMYNQWNHQLWERRKQKLRKLLPQIPLLEQFEYTFNQPKPRRQRFRRYVTPQGQSATQRGPQWWSIFLGSPCMKQRPICCRRNSLLPYPVSYQ